MGWIYLPGFQGLFIPANSIGMLVGLGPQHGQQRLLEGVKLASEQAAQNERWAVDTSLNPTESAAAKTCGPPRLLAARRQRLIPASPGVQATATTLL